MSYLVAYTNNLMPIAYQVGGYTELYNHIADLVSSELPDAQLFNILHFINDTPKVSDVSDIVLRLCIKSYQTITSTVYADIYDLDTMPVEDDSFIQDLIHNVCGDSINENVMNFILQALNRDVLKHSTCPRYTVYFYKLCYDNGLQYILVN